MLVYYCHCVFGVEPNGRCGSYVALVDFNFPLLENYGIVTDKSTHNSPCLIISIDSWAISFLRGLGGWDFHQNEGDGCSQPTLHMQYHTQFSTTFKCYRWPHFFMSI